MVEVDVLVLGVLDELAKEQTIEVDEWDEMVDVGLDVYNIYELEKIIKRGVVLGFLAGRKAEKAEVLKEIESLIKRQGKEKAKFHEDFEMFSAYEQGLNDLKKRLLAKKRFVGGKKNEF